MLARFSLSLFAITCLVIFASIGCKSSQDKPDDTPMTEVVEPTVEPPVVQPDPEPVAKFEDPGCGPEEEACRLDNLGSTKIGWLVEGVPVAVMLEKLGEPDEKEERIEEGATGDIYEVWIWREAGVQADITAPDMTADLVGVRYFTVSPPFDGKTERGVGLGSTEQEVLDAYPSLIEPMSTPGKMIIVGSIYSGIFFGIEEGKVTSIFVGAGAE